ncbi:MAG TPA: hypothetical protein VFN19_07990 [Candidatus Nanopelagicales bacterium]|nr:hypothetical protein [Candidatus Nanopelagicales bacterium]
MATIKATCPMCGDVDLSPRQVRVRVVEAVQESQARRSYTFVCPSCHDRVEKPTEAEVVRLLRSAGVQVTHVDVPAEAREEHAGPPLGYDDLLDFGLLLERADCLADLFEAAPRH